MIFGRSFSSLAKMLSGAQWELRAVRRDVLRTRPKTLNPTWNQRLELRLAGGELNVATGEYDNADAPYTSLRIELWDRDLLTSDDFIGEVTIPLCPCMDKRQHTHTLPLTDPEERRVPKEGSSHKAAPSHSRSPTSRNYGPEAPNYGTRSNAYLAACTASTSDDMDFTQRDGFQHVHVTAMLSRARRRPEGKEPRSQVVTHHHEGEHHVHRPIQ